MRKGGAAMAGAMSSERNMMNRWGGGAGRLQDKKGPFRISVVGSVLFSLGWVLATYAKDLFSLYLTMGVVLGIGSGFGYATPIPVLSKWFPDRRGRGGGRAVAGYGGGSFIISFIGKPMLAAFGWRDTFLYLGIGYFLATMIGAFILKNPPVGWRPPGWGPAAASAKGTASRHEDAPGEGGRTSTLS